MAIHNTSMMNDFPYLYRGEVVDNKDAKNLGRCRVLVPAIHGSGDVPNSVLPWARPISIFPITGDKGSAYVPDIGDIVWVLFEGGNKDTPAYLGGTHGTKDVPVALDRVVVYQEGEDSIIYDRSARIVTIKLAGNLIDVHRGNHINIHADDDVNISGNTVVNVTSDATVNVRAPEINVLGSSHVQVTAPKVDVTGDSQVAVSAPSINLTGAVNISGTLNVSGATTLAKPVSCPGYCHHAPK